MLRASGSRVFRALLKQSVLAVAITAAAIPRAMPDLSQSLVVVARNSASTLDSNLLKRPISEATACAS